MKETKEMEKYILYARKGKGMIFAFENKSVANYRNPNQEINFFTFYNIEMSYIEQMDKGTFKHSYSLEEAERLLKKFYRARRKYKKAGKNRKGYWNDIDLIAVPITKLLKRNKQQLKKVARKIKVR